MSDLLCLIGSVCRFQQHIIQTNKYEFKISKWHKLITKHNLSKNNAQFALMVAALTVVSGKLEISLSYHFSKLSSDTKVAVTQVTSWHLRKVSQTGVMASLPTFLWHNQNFFEHNVHLYYTLFSMFFHRVLKKNMFFLNTAGVQSMVCLLPFWCRFGQGAAPTSMGSPRDVPVPWQLHTQLSVGEIFASPHKSKEPKKDSAAICRKSKLYIAITSYIQYRF